MNERQTPLAPPPPNGPSPSMPVYICSNMELRNTASKSSAAACALAWFAVGFGLLTWPAMIRSVGRQAGGGQGEAAHHITSISAWRAPAALIACRMPIRSRGADAEGVEAVDELLQRHAVLDQRELLAG